MGVPEQRDRGSGHAMTLRFSVAASKVRKLAGRSGTAHDPLRRRKAPLSLTPQGWQSAASRLKACGLSLRRRQILIW
jgi:hypothetical protein